MIVRTLAQHFLMARSVFVSADGSLISGSVIIRGTCILVVAPSCRSKKSNQTTIYPSKPKIKDYFSDHQTRDLMTFTGSLYHIPPGEKPE
jgi:hypothetical protein